MLDLDEVMRRKDLRTVSSGEIKCLFHEVERLRTENLQFAEQVKCEYEHTRVARAWRDEFVSILDYAIHQTHYGGTHGGLSESECQRVHDALVRRSTGAPP